MKMMVMVIYSVFFFIGDCTRTSREGNVRAACEKESLLYMN